MAEPKNIQMPYEIFKKLLNIVDNLNMSYYDEKIKNDFDDVYCFLKGKQRSFDKKELYKELAVTNKYNHQLNEEIIYLSKKNFKN